MAVESRFKALVEAGIALRSELSLDALLQRGVVEVPDRRSARLVAGVDGDGDAAVELHHVRGDVRVREPRCRSFAAVELDFNGVGRAALRKLKALTPPEADGKSMEAVTDSIARMVRARSSAVVSRCGWTKGSRTT